MTRWRYKLPCGHHTYRSKGNKHRSKQNHTIYICTNCRKEFEYKIDKKTGDKVSA